MTKSMTTHLTIAWLALSALTALSWWVGDRHGHGAASTNLPITVAVLGMALIKVRIIIQDFMEVRTAPAWLRVTSDLWLIGLFAGLMWMYWR